MAAVSLRERWSSGVPAVAVSVADDVTDPELADLVDAGLDVVEARIDRFASVAPDDVAATVSRLAAVVPVLATVRSRPEGGEWAGSDADRLALYEKVAALVGAVDVELSSSAILPEVIDAARRHDAVVVVSSHDFERTPPLDELTDRAGRARQAGAEVVKVATLARTPADLWVLASFTLAQADAGDAVIVVAMGDQGPASRVFLPLLGSALTFASTASAKVPGQLTYAETISALRSYSPAYRDVGTKR